MTLASRIGWPRMVVKGPKRRAGVIGVNLRKLRDAAGLSQRALAGKAGVYYVTIANLETGATQSADHDTITKLALALGVREGDLVEALQAAPIEPQRCAHRAPPGRSGHPRRRHEGVAASQRAAPPGATLRLVTASIP